MDTRDLLLAAPCPNCKRFTERFNAVDDGGANWLCSICSSLQYLRNRIREMLDEIEQMEGDLRFN